MQGASAARAGGTWRRGSQPQPGFFCPGLVPPTQGGVPSPSLLLQVAPRAGDGSNGTSPTATGLRAHVGTWSPSGSTAADRAHLITAEKQRSKKPRSSHLQAARRQGRTVLHRLSTQFARRDRSEMKINRVRGWGCVHSPLPPGRSPRGTEMPSAPGSAKAAAGPDCAVGRAELLAALATFSSPRALAVLKPSCSGSGRAVLAPGERRYQELAARAVTSPWQRPCASLLLGLGGSGAGSPGHGQEMLSHGGRGWDGTKAIAAHAEGAGGLCPHHICT